MKAKQMRELDNYIGEPQDYSHKFWQDPLNVKIYMRSMTAGLDPDDADRYAILCGMVSKDIELGTFQEINFECCCQDIEIFDLEPDTVEWDIVLNILETYGIVMDTKEEKIWDALVG